MQVNALLVYPGFRGDSFWSLTPVCELCNVRRPEPPLGLLTLAALLPRDWKIKLVDRNVRELTANHLDWADVVMTGGMIAQRQDTLAVIELCRTRGKPVVVGGPDPTSCEEVYAAADFLVLGEAEGIIDSFLAAWQAGQRTGRFRAEKFTVDVTKTPIPRFDLLRANQYLYIGVQFSRGCPFTCEFCDIIELYGRVPRSKTNAQMLAELQAVYDWGHRGFVNFVDDNLIGNKKALKQFLPELARWQAERGYPFMFTTEASINLADDQQLLDMMGQANFFGLFVGIETPDPATLVAIRKKQNTRRNLAESIRKIHRAGMFVVAGFIVGFDGEEGSVADAMIECIEATNIAGAAIGLLSALPNTQLHRRLQQEGRLPPSRGAAADDLFATTLNFVPLRAERDILLDYRRVLAAVYRPAAYFERVRRAGRRIRRPALRPVAQRLAGSPPGRSRLADRLLRGLGLDRLGLGGMVAGNFHIFLKALAKMTLRGDLRGLFWRTLLDVGRHNPAALEVTIFQMALFLHFGEFAQRMIGELDRRIAGMDEQPAAGAASDAAMPARRLERA